MGEELQTQYDCSAVSQLPRVAGSNALSDDCLLLVSMPTDGQTYTKHLSKALPLDTFAEYVGNKLEFEHTKEELDYKISQKQDISAFDLESTLSCAINNPYVISSMHFAGPTLTAVQGYRLCDVINDVISQNVPERQAFSTVAKVADNQDSSRLANATLSKDGTKLYLHFNIEKDGQQTAKKLTVNLQSIISETSLSDFFNTVYPVGSVFMSSQDIVEDNPLKYGMWEKLDDQQMSTITFWKRMS